ncbi:MAG: hypothetical protein DIJKHBIC_01035 [Thermoanaerobaculia bacterium]|nr:hypothetical protein [Thermoanaerobaculia bacterium]
MRDADSGDLLLVAAGDLSPLDRIIERWRSPLYGFFEKALEPSSAQDAAAEVFFRLYKSAAKYDPSVPFPVWILGLAARVLQDRPAEPMVPIPLPRLKESAAARAALLRSAVRSLPGKERSVFLLTRVSRLQLSQSGAALSTSEDEVRRLLVRAFEGLAAALGPVLEEPEVMNAFSNPARPSGVEEGAA